MQRYLSLTTVSLLVFSYLCAALSFFWFVCSGDAYNADAGKPKLNHGQVCFKYTLLAVNALFFIFGCVLMAVGSYAINNQVGALAGSTIPTGLIVLGVFIMLLALVGGVAAWRESRVFLGCYFVFLLLFTIILFAVGIAVYVKKNDSASLITTAWNDSPPDVKQSLSAYVGCCGLNAWDDATYECPPPFTGAGAPPCLPLMVDIFNRSFTTAGACGIAFSVIMLAGLVFVCYLMTGIRRKSEETDIAKLRTGGDMGVIQGVEGDENYDPNQNGTEVETGQEIGQEDVQYEEEQV
jgi:Na+-transporting methylmalonyl-CoA/oxaloacetate decarboxylase gamma subunit